MHPLDILALAMTFCGIGLAFFIVSIMQGTKLKRRHAAELAEAEFHEHNLMQRVDQQAVSVKELMRHNQRLMRDLAEARIHAYPLHDDPFTQADRRTLLDALVKLTSARCFYGTLNSAEADILLRIERNLMKVVDRLTRHLVADGTLLLQPATKIERDSNGWWLHPSLPLFSEGTTRERQDAWLKLQQLDTQLVWDRRFDEHPDPALGEPDIRGFEPTAPEGDGWFLLTIEQNEDGEAQAWYGRRQALAAESAA